jgi:2-oxoglutarate ferredoxin oxidoreductase subunit delta
MAKQGKLTIDESRCKGCELCVNACPLHLLKLSPSLNAKGYHSVMITDPSQCIGCAACATMCPDIVIKVEREDK